MVSFLYFIVEEYKPKMVELSMCESFLLILKENHYLIRKFINFI
jgi:hypothetical protein